MAVLTVMHSTREILSWSIANGWHNQIQVFVSDSGGPVLNEVLANGADEPAGTRLTTDTLFPQLCVAKPLVALAALEACDTAGVPLSTPVADVITELAGQRSGRIRIIDVLTHQTGYAALPADTAWLTWDWDDCMRFIYENPHDPESIPGGEACYQESRYWFLLGEIIYRVSGHGVHRFLRNLAGTYPALKGMFFGPMELHRSGRLGDVATIGGRTSHQAFLPATDKHGGWRGGATVYSSMRTMAEFMESLVTLRSDMIEPVRTGLIDAYFGSIRDWGLGVMIESRRWGGVSTVFSSYASPRAFGHVARMSLVAFCDPVHDLLVGIAGDGEPNAMTNKYFLRAACNAIFQDLGFASSGQRG